MSINISPRVAVDIVRRAAQLFYDGTGIAIEPLEDLLPNDDGLIDEIPMDSDAYMWANHLLLFVRTVHGIIQNALLEDELNADI